MAHKEHAPEVRASVMSALLSGQGVSEVAREYRLPTSTVSRWRKEARKEAGKSDDIPELLEAYLRESLITLQAQAKVFRDSDWLRAQDAADAAVLHGVMTDKNIRLLEAWEGVEVKPTASTNGSRNRWRQHA